MAASPTAGRLLVTGGSGFLGREVVRAAAAAGWEVVATWCTRRPEEADDVAGVRWVPLDLRDVAAIDALVEDAFAGAAAGAVIHTAYVERGPELLEVTAWGSGHVAAAARRAGHRMVHVSTDVVFDGTTDRPYLEEDDLHPVHDYGRAKAAAEAAVRRGDPGAVIVRTSLVYRGPTGPGPRSKHERDVLDALGGRAPDTRFFTDEWRNPVQVADLAAALLELARRPDVHGPLHVAGADVVSRHGFACLIAAAEGHDPAGVPAGSSAAISTPRPRNCPLDSTRARTLLTTRVRGVHEVLGGP